MASLTLFEPRDFDFSDGYLGSLITVIPLGQKFEVSPFGCGQLLFRLHAGTVPSTASVQVVLVDAAPSVDDPAARFQGAIAGTAALQATTAVALASGFVGIRCNYLAAYLVVLQPPSKDPTFKVTLSAELALKDDTSPWTPAQLSNPPKLWLDDRGQTASAGLVTNWAENSGNTNAFTAGSGAEPAASGRINQLPSPRFNGSTSVMGSTSPLSNIVSNNSYHGFAVVNPLAPLAAFNADPSTNAQVICDAGNGYWGLYVSTLGVQAWHHDSVAALATPATSVIANIWYLVEWSYDGTTIRCRVGPKPATSIAAGNVFNVSGTLALGHGWPGSAFFNGTIGTVLVFAGMLPANDVVAVRGYLSSKYGVPA